MSLTAAAQPLSTDSSTTARVQAARVLEDILWNYPIQLGAARVEARRPPSKTGLLPLMLAAGALALGLVIFFEMKAIPATALGVVIWLGFDRLLAWEKKTQRRRIQTRGLTARDLARAMSVVTNTGLSAAELGRLIAALPEQDRVQLFVKLGNGYAHSLHLAAALDLYSELCQATGRTEMI